MSRSQQKQAEALIQGRARIRPSPAHNPSHLVFPSPLGGRVVREMLAREKGLLGPLELPRSRAEIAQAAEVLRDMRRALEPLRSFTPVG